VTPGIISVNWSNLARTFESGSSDDDDVLLFTAVLNV